MRTKFLSSGPIKVNINKAKLQRDIFVGGAKVIIKTVTPVIRQRLEEEQEKMVDEFETHPVSQEISAGNEASNSSGLLGGYGNLFSFIGFDEGSDPISPISKLMRRKIPFSIRNISDKGSYMVTLEAPDKSEIYSKAQVSWMGGRSWMDGIEKGIAGLNKYLYDGDGFNYSRSGTGIQTEKNVHSVIQGRTPYVSEILNNFRKRLSKLL